MEPWRQITPLWYSQVGTPTIGNGTLRARYRRSDRDLAFQLELVAGSTTTFGTSGYWIFDPQLRLLSVDGLDAVLPALAYDASAGLFYTGSAWLTDATGYLVVVQEIPPYTLVHVSFGQGVARAGPATPFAWATGDWLRIGNAAESFDI